jgi:hypothetical protein
MRCYQVGRLIEDFRDGELAAGQAAEVEAHLRDCETCRQELAVLKREAGIYEAYAAGTERALNVSPELWQRALADSSPLAQARLANDRRDKGGLRWLGALVPASSWARQALAAVLLVAISVSATLLIVGHYRSRDMGAMQQAYGNLGPSGDKSLDEALKSIQRAEQEYLRAIQQLDAIVEKQKPSLDPRIYAELQVNLKLIDEHIAATRNAYYAHPQDAELALYMLAAYSRKVELLQNLTS